MMHEKISYIWQHGDADTDKRQVERWGGGGKKKTGLFGKDTLSICKRLSEMR